MQRQVKISGMIGPCPTCGKQPKHYEWKGRHSLECSPCLAKTAYYPTFQEAVEFWERHETTMIRGKL